MISISMTKPVEKEIIQRHVHILCMWYRDGRHAATPTYAKGEDGIEEMEGAPGEEQE